MGGQKLTRRPGGSAPGAHRPQATPGSRAKGVLFLCVANSSRSQMAEGIARRMAPRGVKVFSAGSRPGGLNPLAVETMAEIGIDISGHAAKALKSIPLDDIATAVFLCAEESCPVFPVRVERIHWPMADPAAATGSHSDRMKAFRRARTELRRRIGALMEIV